MRILIVVMLICVGTLNAVQTEKPNTHLGAENATKAAPDKVISGISYGIAKDRHLSLAGEWKCVLDEGKGYRGSEVGIQEKWYAKPFVQSQPIQLPGTLAMAKIGKPNPKQSRYTLTPETINTWVAWYQKEVEIPESWRNKVITIFFERCGWESRLWIDGEPVGIRDSLSTPHEYVLPKGLAPGKRLLTVRMDSAGRPGASCHGWGEDMQTYWNGIMGRMEMSAKDPVYVESIRIDAKPSGEEGIAKLDIVVKNLASWTMRGVLKLSIRRKGVGDFVAKGEANFHSGTPEMTVSTRIPIEKGVKEWSEFEPNLYEIKVECLAEGEGLKTADQLIETFGVRTIEARKGDLYINGKKAYLRGTHDGCAFPLTGSMSCDVEEWRRICKIVKSYGLNHIRYHSVCPPKAAFIAADEEGVYLQSELPHWGDVKKGWAGTAFLRSELDRIIDAFGNHPSFCLMTMGNEHPGEWDILEDFVVHAKKKDSRRLYAAVSNAYIYPGAAKGFPVMPEDQFWVSMLAGVPKTGPRIRFRYMEEMMANKFPDRANGYSNLFDDNPAPGISHELGQFVVFPNLKEISKYTGVMKARNFERFKRSIEEVGMLDQAEDFFKASGGSAVEFYKEDIERILRTPECAGFQLLDIRDYPGQGTALVGILDVFWDSKGLITPEKFRHFCDRTVLLSSIEKSVWSSGDVVKIPLSAVHFDTNDIVSPTIEWRVANRAGKVLKQGKLTVDKVSMGGTTSLGIAEFATDDIKQPEELTLTARIAGTKIENGWRIWCYPKENSIELDSSKVLKSTQLDDKTISFLQSGGKVLLTASGSNSLKSIEASNAIWTPWNSIRTLGMLIQNQHPAFELFPCRYHTDWQWWDLLEPFSYAFSIPDKSIPIKPIAQPIDEPIANLKLGILFEAKVGKGSVLATSIDVANGLEKRPATRQFLKSLESYVGSKKFNPKNEITLEQLKLVVDNPRFSVLKDAPTEGKVVLDVVPSGALTQKGMHNWKKENDKLVSQETGFDWRLERDESKMRWPGPANVSWCNPEQSNSGWMTGDDKLVLKVPENFTGTVYLYARDLSKGNRRGEIIIGREVVRQQTDDKGTWVGIHITPVDIKNGEVSMSFARPSSIDPWSTNPIYEKLRVIQK